MLGKGRKGKCTPDGRPCVPYRPLHTVPPCPGQVFSPLGCGVYRLAVILFFGGVLWLVLRFILRFLPHLQRGLRLVLPLLLLRHLLFRRPMCPCRVVLGVHFLAGSLSFVLVLLCLLGRLLVCGRGGLVSLVSCVAWPSPCLAFPWGRCPLFSAFSSVGFSGSRSLSGGAVGDIGSHCENLVSYITGLEIEALCADLTTFVPGRLLDDDVNVMLRFGNGAKGLLWCSQIAAGEENGLNIRVYGTKAGLEWHQEHPNWLYFRDPAGPMQVYKRGNDYIGEAAQRASHLPFGHPEAFFEAFGNIFMNVTDTIRARLVGAEPSALELDFPDVYDGARGVKFIEKVVESNQSEQKWLPFA